MDGAERAEWQFRNRRESDRKPLEIRVRGGRVRIHAVQRVSRDDEPVFLEIMAEGPDPHFRIFGLRDTPDVLDQAAQIIAQHGATVRSNRR